MKLLVPSERACVQHRAVGSSEQELVIPASCEECDPSQTKFIGLESGQLYDYATVIERPDMNFDTLVSLVRVCLRQFLHLQTERRKLIRQFAINQAQWITALTADLPVGDLLGRRGSQTYSVVFENDRTG